MCGITGYLATKGALPSGLAGAIAGMAAAIDHRGPDASGVWFDEAPGIALGHTRLSILDLSPAGAQPMRSRCGRYVLCFNGEIYNHLDLRAELKASGAGADWRGHSDTETLLAGIVAWGLEGTLRRAKGMFALGLWDSVERTLCLARDRFGEKPLYWGWADDALIFGSELKALRSYPRFQAGVNRAALGPYLRFAYVPAPLSVYDGVFKLEPGTILRASGTLSALPPREPLRPGDSWGGIEIKRYWSLDEVLEQGARDRFEDEQDCVAAVERTLRESVQRQMLADVPLGAFLSGGIDSSLIVALMQEQSTQPVQTFTIGFEAEAYNEAPHAAAVAQHLGTRHSELVVTEADARAFIPRIAEVYDEPFADSSQIPTFFVCQSARSAVTVALSGDAGDELFGGYNRYFWGPRLWRALSIVPAPARRALSAALRIPSVQSWDRVGRATGGNVALLGDKVHKLADRLSGVDSLEGLYRSLVSEWREPGLVRDRGSEMATLIDDPLPTGALEGTSSWMAAQDMRTYLPDDILCKVDRAAMSMALETRVPFLDPDVVAISTRVPLGMKIRDGRGKWVLRQILDRHVPRELIDRPKAGFGIPIGRWLREPLREWAEDLLSEAHLRADGLLEPRPVRQAWEEHLTGKRDWTQKIWIVLMLMSWRARWG